MDKQQLSPSAFLAAVRHFYKLDWTKKLTACTQPEFLALSAVYHAQLRYPERPGVYVSVLADELLTSVSMVSKMLKTLEGKNWILRTVDPGSRRNTFVSLTEEGRQVLSKASVELEAIHNAVIEKIGKDRMQEFIRISADLARCYEEALV